MKITKRQLRRIIKEEIAGYDPHDFMEKITAIDNELGELYKGMPFRSAGVRMVMEKVVSAMFELDSAMKEEMKHLEQLGDRW